MNKLKVSLKNCFGIQSLDHEFDFSGGSSSSKPKAKAYAIYAPNGLMKSSFAKTFDALSKGDSPREERFGHEAIYEVKADGADLAQESIYVLKSDIDIQSETPAITNILVNPEHKAKYDELLVDLDKRKDALIKALQKKSKVRKADIEQQVINDYGEKTFPECLKQIIKLELINNDDFEPYTYDILFDPKVQSILESSDFITNANEFNERYQELFQQAGTIYQKGVFNPTRAEASFKTLEKNGFFIGGHRVHLKGEPTSIDQKELNQKIEAILASIDTDVQLKNLRLSLAKNAQTQALTDLIEQLSPIQVDFLLEKIQPENQTLFKQELWAFYVQSCKESNAYLEAYTNSEEEINKIETAAAQVAPRWIKAVELFNERFVDMPFQLELANQVEAALGKEQAKLEFIFTDGEKTVKCSRSQIKALSQGEKRALYLLNFIFEVEARKLNNQETLFIIDDVADSFDYKNKQAIIQYLNDLCGLEYFYQIILTHNFDFFRSLANSFVFYKRCLMANKSSNKIGLIQAKGIKNYFIGEWKNKVTSCDKILCSTIPFVRNLIEYTKGEEDKDYITLTSLLHWKYNTEEIYVNDYLSIYDNLFGSQHNQNQAITPKKTIKDLIFEKAQDICIQSTHEGLNLEDKVLLSIAIRLKSEIFIILKIRELGVDKNY